MMIDMNTHIEKSEIENFTHNKNKRNVRKRNNAIFNSEIIKIPNKIIKTKKNFGFVHLL